MPDFSVTDSFNSAEAYTQVKFGNDAKILEVELNEMQKILAYRSALVGKLLIKDGFITKGAMNVTTGILTVPADTIVTGGSAYEILDPMTIAVANADVIYLAITTAEVNGTSTIKQSGNQSGGTLLTNDILDPRMGGMETTRRMQVQVQLTKTTGAPNTVYLAVCTMTSASAFTDNRTKCYVSMDAGTVDGYDLNQDVKNTASPSFIKITSTVATGTAPFVVASTTKVVNLNADQVDGYNLNQDVQTTASPSFVKITSTVATGTAPFVVASTTVVPNLNADLLDGQHGSYYAPIASPTFTGVPAAPNAAVNTNTTQIATTAFVLGQVGTAAPVMNGVAAVGVSLLYARQDHVHASDTTKANLASPTFTETPAAPTAAVSTNTTQIATTAFVLGQAGTAAPVMNGVAAVGVSLLYARQDHVHASDTSRAPVASPTFTGIVTAPTFVSSVAVGTAPFTVTSTTKVVNLNADTVDGLHTDTAATASTVAARDTSGNLTANAFASSVATGTAPFTVTSTTKVVNLNADTVDGYNFDQSTKTTDSPTHVGITLTQATGTAPLIVTSTTKVTNLNADLLDGFDSATTATANTVAVRDASGKLTANAFTSSVATGTAPFTVTSTTKVANLNADLLDGFDSASFTPFATLTGTTAATAGWYRIAASAINIGTNSGLIKVDFSGAGVVGRALFSASCQGGVTAGTNINLVGYTASDYTKAITQARIVYNTTATGYYAYVEVYNPTALALTLSIDIIDTTGWSLVTPSTAGSVPGGYTSLTMIFDTGVVSMGDITAAGRLISNIATGTAPLTVTSTTVVTHLNADQLDGQHGSYYAPIASPTFTGTPAAPTAAVSTNTTQVATTAFVLGQVGTAAPIMNGTAAVGTSLLYARQDHVHASDTAKANLASPTFTGIVTAPTFASSVAVGTAPFTVTSTTVVTHLNADVVDGFHADTVATVSTLAARDTNGNINANAFVSSVATGTAPFVVTSATKVANLNADQVDGYHFNQDVQNTASPSFVSVTSTVSTGTAPLTVASTTVVPNLNADQVDGYHFNQDVQNTASPSFVSVTSTIASGTAPFVVASNTVVTNLNADTIDGFHADATATVSTVVARDTNGNVNANAFVSSVATGTTPLTVTSTTKVANLNADLLDGQEGSYYAPIASPTFTGTPAAPTATVSTNTTQVATTAFVLGQAGTATPVMNGTAAIGTSLLYARQDHVHASDTTKANLASPAFTGVPTAPTATAGTNTTQIATTAFVQAYDDSTKANLASPTFTGTVVLPSTTSIGSVTATELSYVDATSSIQTQLNAKLASSSYTAADVLAKLKTVDGAGSGLDADLVNGLDASTSATASTVAVRDASGYLKSVLFNESFAIDNLAADAYFYEYNNDGNMRKKSLANAANELFNAATSESKAQNGYIKFANGIIVQWGASNVTTTALTVTFPIAFSSTNMAVVGGIDFNGGLSGYIWNFSILSASQMKMWGSSSTAYTVTWVAIGY